MCRIVCKVDSVGYRAGYYPRGLVTRVGKLDKRNLTINTRVVKEASPVM